MKKNTAGIIAFSLMLVLGVSFVAAFPMMGGHWDVSEEEIQVQAQFMEQVQQSIQDEDFDTWESLMQSQITQANFQLHVERHKQMQEQYGANFTGQGRMMGQCPYVEGNLEDGDWEGPMGACSGNPEDCPYAGEGKGPMNGQGNGQMHKSFNQDVREHRWSFWKGFGKNRS